MRAIVILAVAVVLFLIGATTSRAYVASSNLWPLTETLVLYTLGNLVMISLMRTSGLLLAVSLSAVAQLVAVNAIAYIVFDERLGWTQGAGVLLGIASVTLWFSARLCTASVLSRRCVTCGQASLEYGFSRAGRPSDRPSSRPSKRLPLENVIVHGKSWLIRLARNLRDTAKMESMKD